MLVRRDRQCPPGPVAQPSQGCCPDAARPEVSYDLVLVGGVPGAGKTTAIAQACHDLDHVRTVDPEQIAQYLHRLPARVPYRAFRWLVHLLHTLRVLVHLIGGPVDGRRLVVHDPGTRARRRSLYLRLAHLRGWRTVLLYIDVDRSTAREGQLRRGRVVRSFDEHWARWQHLRPALEAAADRRIGSHGRGTPADQDQAHDQADKDLVVLVDRAEAATVLRRLAAAPCA